MASALRASLVQIKADIGHRLSTTRLASAECMRAPVLDYPAQPACCETGYLAQADIQPLQPQLRYHGFKLCPVTPPRLSSFSASDPGRPTAAPIPAGVEMPWSSKACRIIIRSRIISIDPTAGLGAPRPSSLIYSCNWKGFRRQMASLSSLAVLKAIFLLALISITWPVAGLRPLRAGRSRT